jgi:transcriptional regulator with XRE-family HTH domain
MSSPNSLSPQNVSAARFIGDVREELLQAYLEELTEHGLTKSDIARALGVNRSVVSRILNGSAPLELRTLAQLAWALGRTPEFKLPKRRKRAHGINTISVTNSVTNTAPAMLATVTP